MRGPLVGYNHNVRYGGRLFHVQSEDSGAKNPHIFTHLFYEGTIVATRRADYAREAPEPDVRAIMQGQHKSIMKELKLGSYDDKIAAFFAARSQPVVPAEPEAYMAAGPGAVLTTALDLDAIGPKSSPISVSHGETAPEFVRRASEYVHKGGQKERVSLTAPAEFPRIKLTPPPLAAPVVRLRPAPVAVAARVPSRGFATWLAGLFGRAPEPEPASTPAAASSATTPRPIVVAPAAPAMSDGVPHPLVEVSENEIDDLISSFLSDEPGHR